LRALQRRGSTGGLLVDEDLSALRDERRRCTDRLDAAVDEVSDATEVLSRVDCRVLLPLVEDRVRTAINENKVLLWLHCTAGLLDVPPPGWSQMYYTYGQQILYRCRETSL